MFFFVKSVYKLFGKYYYFVNVYVMLVIIIINNMYLNVILCRVFMILLVLF